MALNRPYEEKRAHILCASRAFWIVAFVSLYPGTLSSGTNEITGLNNDSDLNKIENALLSKWPNLTFWNGRMPIGDVKDDPYGDFIIDVVRIRRDYFPLIPEIGDYLIECVNQLLNVPNGQGEIVQGMPAPTT